MPNPEKNFTRQLETETRYLAKLHAKLEDNFLLSEEAIEENPTRKIMEYFFNQLKNVSLGEGNQKDRQKKLEDILDNSVAFYVELMDVAIPYEGDEKKFEIIKKIDFLTDLNARSESIEYENYSDEIKDLLYIFSNIKSTIDALYRLVTQEEVINFDLSKDSIERIKEKTIHTLEAVNSNITRLDKKRSQESDSLVQPIRRFKERPSAANYEMLIGYINNKDDFPQPQERKQLFWLGRTLSEDINENKNVDELIDRYGEYILPGTAHHIRTRGNREAFESSKKFMEQNLGEFDFSDITPKQRSILLNFVGSETNNPELYSKLWNKFKDDLGPVGVLSAVKFAGKVDSKQVFEEAAQKAIEEGYFEKGMRDFGKLLEAAIAFNDQVSFNIVLNKIFEFYEKGALDLDDQPEEKEYIIQKCQDIGFSKNRAEAVAGQIGFENEKKLEELYDREEEAPETKEAA